MIKVMERDSQNPSSFILDEKTSNTLTDTIEKISITSMSVKSDKNYQLISDIIHNLDSVQLAYFLLTSKNENKKKLINIIGDKLDPTVLLHLNYNLKTEIIKIIGIKKINELILPLHASDIFTIIEDLDKEYQTYILKHIPKQSKNIVTELFTYPIDTAGRLIHKDMIIVPEHWNVGQLMEFLHHNKIKNYHQIFVVNPELKPVANISLKDILFVDKKTSIKKIMNFNIKTINFNTTQEEVASIFRKYYLLSAPVVNNEGRIIGIILIDDIMDVIYQELEEDILSLGGLTQKDVYSPWYSTVISRLPWLTINLLTSTLVSIIIGFFSDALNYNVELSIIMPVMASMSGNAGLQALTVAIRSLSTKQLTSRNTKELLLKESLVGFINGIILAIISAIIIIIRFNDLKLQFLFSISMIITFTLSTFIGAAIPIVLNKVKIDPAISSSILICAVSDAIAYSIFLGLASIFLLHKFL